jgi:RNA polymerase sigma-54 factor
MPDLGLQQQLGLSQTLSPQMQQSLHYLQAPMMELRSLVHQEMQSNPVLEESAPEPENDTEDWDSELEEARKQQEEWSEYFQQSSSTGSYNPDAQKKRDFWFESQTEHRSLTEHLLEQLHLSITPPLLNETGEAIIGNLDDNGFLTLPLEEVAQASGVSIEKAEEALQLIQSFHPPGVAARDIRESLLIQLRQRGREDSLEHQIVDHHFELLGKKKIQDIAKKLKVDLQRVQEAADYIASLQPRPGALFSADNPHHIVQAEAAILKVDGEWVVQLNEDPIPRIRISNTYKDLLGQAHNDTQVRSYLRDRIRAGKFLIKCIHQRQDTVLKLLNELITRQRDFLEEGVSALKPMTMSQVSAAVGVHETTISRAVANKHVQTPWGLFPLKFFFTSGYRTASGQKMSNTSVKERIQELVAREDGRQPLSDADIVDILQEEGLKVARRTVAKYRMESNILPSHLRRRAN